MKRLFLVLFISLHAFTGYCQAPNWLWAITGGGGIYQFGSGLSASPSGDIYFCGRIAGSVNLGGQAATAGGSTTVVKGRFNGAGTFSWLKPYVYSSSFDYPWGFWRDEADNSYSSGTVSSGSEIFVDKMNSAGVSAWNVRVPCAGNGGGYGVTTDNTGNVFATGMISGSMNFGVSTVTSVGSWDIYLAKYNSNGVCQWAINAAAGTGYDVSRSIVCDKAGNIYLWGSYTQDITFPGGTITLPNAGTYPNMFIAKYSPTGTPLWAIYATNAGITNGSWNDHTGLAMDSCGNLYTCGYFQGTAQFGGTSITSAGLYDLYVAKILANGQWEWVKRAGSTSYDGAESLVLDKNFDIYISGFFNGTVQFGAATGQTVTSAGLNDVFVAKYANSTGDIQWAQRGGGSQDEDGTALAVDNNKFSYITGPFNGTATFGPSTLTATTTNNILIAKLDSVPDRQINVQLPASYSYCTGAPIALPFTTIGTFNSGNAFTAQLSDTNGSFINPIAIGSVNGTSGSTVTVTMPGNLYIGKYYTIRIVSSNPAYSSFDYCQRILITGPCSPDILNGDGTILDTVYCFENINHEIKGEPGGGSFSGCGIVDSAGKWYFNPAIAAFGSSAYPHKCFIRYKLPTGQDSIQLMTVNRPVIPNAGPSQTICVNSFVLSATANYNGFQFAWAPAAGLNTPGEPITAGTTQQFKAVYTITATDPQTGCRGTDTTVIYNNTLTALFDLSKDSLCQGDTLSLINNSTGSTPSFLWNFGDGDTTTQRDPRHLYTRGGSYIIKLSTANDFCKDSTTDTVYIFPRPIDSIALYLSDSMLCAGGSVMASAVVPEGYSSIEWDFGNGYISYNSPAVTRNFELEGSYIIKIKGLYTLCPSLEAEKMVLVKPYPLVSLGDDTSLCPGSSGIMLVNLRSQSGPYNHMWSTLETSESIIALQPGEYYLTVTTEFGCATTDTVLIKPNCYAAIPNAFTPNGDDVNDYFFPRQMLSRGVKDFHMQVFNRWGVMIFETSSINGRGWDGTYNDVAQPGGVYVYLIDITYVNNISEKYKGNVSLLR